MKHAQRTLLVCSRWTGPLARLRYAIVLAAIASSLSLIAVFSARPPDHPVPGCPGASEHVVPVTVQLEKFLSTETDERVLDTPRLTDPGVRFPGASGSHLMQITDIRMGEDDIASPWNLLLDSQHWYDSYECEALHPAPIHVSEHSQAYSGHTDTSRDCHLEPSWIVSEGLRFGEDDFLIVAHSATVKSHSGFMFRGPSSSYEAKLIVARGPEPFWRFSTLYGAPETAPAPAVRLDGDDVLLCLPEGFYRFPAATLEPAQYQRWPRRLSSQPKLRWSWVVSVLALAACSLGAVARRRRRRELTRPLSEAEPEDAVVTSVSPQALTLRTAKGPPLALPWRHVVDLFRAGRDVGVMCDPTESPFPLDHRGAKTVTWDPRSSETGQVVTVILGPRQAGAGPYRSSLGGPAGVTWVLHHRTTLNEARRALSSIAVPPLWTWWCLLLDAVAILTGLVELLLS